MWREQQELEELRVLGYDRNAIMAWAARRQVAVGNRRFKCARSVYKVKRVGKRSPRGNRDSNKRAAPFVMDFYPSHVD